MAVKKTFKQTHLGTHIIAELFGCKKINKINFIRESLEKAAAICGATVLHTKLHKFSPRGVTGYVLLAESHISIHTWPEHDYAAVDVFTCGLMNTEKAVHYLGEQFGAKKVKTRIIKRGEKI